MSIHQRREAVFECAHITSGPHIMHQETSSSQPGNIRERDRLVRRGGARVEHEDMRSLHGGTGVELGRRGGCGAEGQGGLAGAVVLRECEKFGVLDDQYELVS